MTNPFGNDAGEIIPGSCASPLERNDFFYLGYSVMILIKSYVPVPGRNRAKVYDASTCWSRRRYMHQKLRREDRFCQSYACSYLLALFGRQGTLYYTRLLHRFYRILPQQHKLPGQGTYDNELKVATSGHDPGAIIANNPKFEPGPWKQFVIEVGGARNPMNESSFGTTN
jgi:hypothetical protein